jgi:hypothetical protein|tara:strand:- start:67 stop:435 length:369 start_codon:yes stop_codon:yes gene_type:complete
MKNKVIMDLKEGKNEKLTDYMSTWLAVYRIFGIKAINKAKSIDNCWDQYTKRMYSFYRKAKKGNWYPNLDVKYKTKSFPGSNDNNHRYSKAWIMYIVQKYPITGHIEYFEKNYNPNIKKLVF